MTYAQVVTQVKRMSQAEKLALMKVLADTLVVDEPAPAKRKRTIRKLYGALNVGMIANPKETPRQRARRLAALPSAEELTGVIRVGERAPTDEEIKEDYIQHLIEKYK